MTNLIVDARKSEPDGGNFILNLNVGCYYGDCGKVFASACFCC